MDHDNKLSFVKDLQLVAPVNLLRRTRCYEGIFQGDVDYMTQEE